MSVRAYKIIKIERESIPSFSLWNDDDVIELLDDNLLITDQTDEAGGIIELKCNEFRDWYENEWEEIKEEIDSRGGDIGELATNQDFIKRAEEIFIQLLQDAKDEEYIQYYCL